MKRKRTAPVTRTTRRSCRPGLSLLEVILAIAILGGSLAVLGGLVRLGSRSGIASRELTTAQLLCQSIMSEVAVGIIPAQPTQAAPVETVDTDQGWYYSVAVEQIDVQGLMAVQVTVEKQLLPGQQPVSFSLIRWMIDPQVELEKEMEAETAATQTTGSSSTTSTTSTGSSP